MQIVNSRLLHGGPVSHAAFVEFWLKSLSLNEALPAVHDALTDTRSFEGCIQVDVFVDNAAPTHLIVIERWTSPENLAAYRKWRAGEGALTHLAPFLEKPPATDKYSYNPDI
jgi:quinol monooxygenase YgiN